MKTNHVTAALSAPSTTSSSRGYRPRRPLLASPWVQRGLIAVVLGMMLLSLFSGR